MTVEYISREVRRIHNKYAIQDPQDLCRAMKISLLFLPMGDSRNACKGFYLRQSRKQAIVVNSLLPAALQQIILVHEIGHAVLHRRVPGMKAFHDFTFFDETSLYEYEANIFAADYLLSDDAVLTLLGEGVSLFAVASRLCVPWELLDFKLRVLRKKGCGIIESPVQANSDFLKHIKLPGETYE